MVIRWQSDEVYQDGSSHLLELTSEGLFILDSHARITFANRAFRAACGSDPLGLKLWELVTPSVREPVQTKIERFLTGDAAGLKLELQLAATTNALDLTLSRRDGRRDEVYGQAHILTHHELRASSNLVEHKLRALHDSELFLITVSEVDSARFLDVNRGFERIYNLRAENALGKTAIELGLISAEEHARHAVTLHHQGKRNLNALTLRASDGRPITLLMHTSVLGDCEPALTLTIAADVTDYIAAEQRGKESDTRWRVLFETLTDGMFFADLDGRFFDVNSAACQQLGYTREELLQLNVHDVAPNMNTTMQQLVERVQSTPQLRFEGTHRRKDGSLFPVEITLCIIPLHSRFAVACIARDLTEQRRIEAESREAHIRMQAILQALPDLLFEIDEHGVICDFYSLRADMLTVPMSEFLGKPLAKFAMPETAGLIMRGVAEALETGFSSGTQYPVRGQRWFELSAARRPVPPGQPARVVALARDITERKHYEQELLRSNEELSRFTYTVSHDLKSPLVTIRSFAGMLRKDLTKGDAERVERDLHFIEKAATRMHQLLDDLLQLSRVGRKSAPPERLSLQELTREACELVAGQIAQNGAQIELTSAPLYFMGDRTRMLEVFQNVIDNAIKFAKPNEPARIKITIEQGTDSEPWVVCVRDYGIGIDPRFKHRLFGLFEKLQPDAAGTGVGLALIKRIIEVHGGRVWIDSDGVNEGVALRFTLPSMTQEEAA